VKCERVDRVLCEVFLERPGERDGNLSRPMVALKRAVRAIRSCFAGTSFHAMQVGFAGEGEETSGHPRWTRRKLLKGPGQVGPLTIAFLHSLFSLSKKLIEKSPKRQGVKAGQR